MTTPNPVDVRNISAALVNAAQNLSQIIASLLLIWNRLQSPCSRNSLNIGTLWRSCFIRRFESPGSYV
jgi:hypothetical protein